MLHYVRSTQQLDANHIDSIRFYERSEFLQLDQVTARNLELTDTLFSDSSQETTLFHTLDCCLTPMGKRFLRASILRPLLDRAPIERRYEAVGELRADLVQREQVRRALTGILDLERLLARISLDSAGPRDLLALAHSLARLPGLKNSVAPLAAAAWRDCNERLDPLEDLCAAVESTLLPEPPLTLAEGGVIAPGINGELDSLRTIGQSGRQSIAAIEERERARTGINSLKVRFNSVFGYYIEITKSNLTNVPADYERKQTLVNAERFTTPELKDYEVRVLTAHERAIEIEKRLFAELRATVLTAASRIRRTSTVVAEIDLLSNFAHLAALHNYVRPQLEDALILEAVAARHPVVERLMENSGEGRFIPNDLYLDTEGPSLLLITGPNMGGKSTYLRQAALLVILAQMGCFVPADRLRLGLVDRIYTRIGASDNVARGRSTFMVEMTETASILNTATRRSLVLLDEMGRGTATFDGLSLAWATVEFLHAEVGARTLFATHYHELTLLAEQLPRLKNLRVTVKETPRGIVFLHAIEPGAASKSYGIEVARLAGLPAPVLERARQVLRQHERSERRNVAVETEAATANDHVHAALAAHRRSSRSNRDQLPHPAAGPQPSRRIEERNSGRQVIVAAQTLRRLVGQIMIIGVESTQLTLAERAWIKLLQPGGIILFRRNIEAVPQTRELLREASTLSSALAFRCVDVEGGLVDRLRDVLAPVPSAAAVAATGSRHSLSSPRRPHRPRSPRPRLQYHLRARARSRSPRIRGGHAHPRRFAPSGLASSHMPRHFSPACSQPTP